ncbi:MAG TPA: hypothetical protein VKG44_11515, partial [Candidatus Baltobacteraceae bacterium]|nr:hypothetical protein [Candidatus Baltobacteraceae bacterium]
DVRSSFMRWLNNSDGRLERVAGVRRREWRFSREPFVAPEGCRLLNVAGLWSHKHPGDGVVPLYSATLGGRVPHEIIEASDATHLNLSGAWNLFTLFFRGWRSDDALWPQVVAQAARFFREASDEIAP